MKVFLGLTLCVCAWALCATLVLSHSWELLNVDTRQASKQGIAVVRMVKHKSIDEDVHTDTVQI